MVEAFELTACEAADALRKKELSARELVASTLGRIERVEKDIHAYQLVLKDYAEQRAAAIDERRAKGDDLPPWAGIPIALKDNFCLRDFPATCSSRILENFIPPLQWNRCSEDPRRGVDSDWENQSR